MGPSGPRVRRTSALANSSHAKYVIRMRKRPRLFHLLGVAQRAVAAAAERESAPLGVTPAQFGLLYCLEGPDPVSLATIGRALDLSPAGLTGLVDRMVAAGLIARQPAAQDRRAVDIVITARGADLRAASLPVLDRLNDQLFAGVPPEHQAIIADYLASLPARLKPENKATQPDTIRSRDHL